MGGLSYDDLIEPTIVRASVKERGLLPLHTHEKSAFLRRLTCSHEHYSAHPGIR